MARNWVCIKDSDGNVEIGKITKQDVDLAHTLNMLCAPKDFKEGIDSLSEIVPAPVIGTPCVSIYYESNNTTCKMTAGDIEASLKNVFADKTDKDISDNAHKKKALLEAAKALQIPVKAYASSLDCAA